MAFETDRQAPFGGIIVANQTVAQDLAEEIQQIFVKSSSHLSFQQGLWKFWKEKESSPNDRQ